MQIDQQRRQQFVEQVARVLGDRLPESSERQEDLLDKSLGRLLLKGRPISDEEIRGSFEMITEYVSPLAHEQLAKDYLASRKIN